MAKLQDRLTITADELAEMIRNYDYPDYAAACEEYYSRQLEQLIQDLAARDSLSFVLISGPTNSGKTTTTMRLQAELNRLGHECNMISLDDYYIEGAVRYDDEGRPDFESLDTISLNLLAEDLRLLQEGKAAWVPHFDFKTRTRIYDRKQKVQLRKGDIILVEGLHALADEIRRQLSPERSFGIMLMPHVELETRSGNIDSEMTRKIRRMHRDNLHRNTRPLENLDFWPMVAWAEETFVPAYLESADLHLNTALPYEYALLGPAVKDLLLQDLAAYEEGTLRKSPNVRDDLFYANIERTVAEARDLLAILAGLPRGDRRVVPNNSVLNEFL